VTTPRTTAEAKTLATAEHKRNYNACLLGSGYCDRSRLSAVEMEAIRLKRTGSR